MKILMLLSMFLSGVSGSGVSRASPLAAHMAYRPSTSASDASTSVWQWPLVGTGGSPPTVVRPFDPPTHRWLPGHRGVDLDARGGATRVVAAGSGTVTFAGTLFGEGVVVIEHHGVRTTYEPVRAIVHAGDAVVAGTPIGTLAVGHCTSGPCLHWGLLTGHGHDVRYYDPLLLVGRVRLRLEPVS
jgi:murein DD-endopeptidase MepM/ murein hydrolase activator NlpD